MKNWKFVKVENTAHSDKVDVIKRLLAGGWSVQDIYEQLKTEGYEVEKNFIEKLKTGNESIEKQEWSMFKGLAKDAEKEVGNNTTKGIDYIALDVPLFVRLLEFAKEDAKSDMDLHTVTENILRIQQTKNETNTAGSFLTMKDYADIVDLNEKTKEVGNKGQWDSKKMVYAKWDDEKGRPSEEFAKITWLGDGKGGVVNVWKGSQMTSEKYGSKDLEELRRWAEQRIGNARLGKFLMEGGHTAELVEEGGKFIIKFDDGSTETFMTRKAAEAFLKVHSELYIGNKVGNEKVHTGIKRGYNGLYWAEVNGQMIKGSDGPYFSTEEKAIKSLKNFLKDNGFESLEKVGNETKAERKFGKVMREFDRGELKSSSGETVTNPEQAKAIAYSESKDVNNLKRARNSIKTKNGMGVSDLEAQIRKNKEFIRQQKMRMNGKSKPEQDDIAEGIREAEEEIDRMEMRIAELKETGNKKVKNKKFRIVQETPFGNVSLGEWEANSAQEAVKEFIDMNPAFANGKKGHIAAYDK